MNSAEEVEKTSASKITKKRSKDKVRTAQFSSMLTH